MTQPAPGPAASALPRGKRYPVRMANAALAGLVILVVGLMVVPLPTWVLDLLLASNLAASVAVLLVTLYVTDALKIAAFPAVLLLTTLIRLALNVSSTRLILLQADAGRVIQSFGDFVVSGNYVVGGVIFFILAIIQFVVIAKGSERVAEVAARFSLDAMPGKQMAVDAELRGGSIDQAEARRRRHELTREGQFYGAMDGAMKFVKGDVIASFLITAINLLGGLAIGIGQRGLDASEALRRYGLLTIGDGLVSQIPALVLATAAGILVTRVASEHQDQSLGEELTTQLFRTPQALTVASLFVTLLAIVPGLPTIPFFVIAVLLFGLSLLRRRQLTQQDRRRSAEPVERGPDEAPSFLPWVRPWTVELSPPLDRRWGAETRHDQTVATAVQNVRERLFMERGIPLPMPSISVNPHLGAGHLTISLHEIPAAELHADPEASPSQLSDWFSEQALALLRRQAHDFIGLSETQSLLDRLERVAPAAVRQVVPSPLSVTDLTEVLRRLAEEGVSIRDLKGILDALAQMPKPKTKTELADLSEQVRVQLRRGLTYDLTRGAEQLAVIQLTPDIEALVRESISETPGGAFLSLAPAVIHDLNQGLERLLEQHSERFPKRAVLLTQPDIRRHVRRLFEGRFPELRVVSYDELTPGVNLDSVARLSIGGL